MVDPVLSEKRRAAGRKGAQVRWGRNHSNGNEPSFAMPDGKPLLKIARPVARLRQGRNDWYRIENRSADLAAIYIYDEIGYWGVTAQDFIRDLADVAANRIELHLNTPGGDVFDGIAIYNALKTHAAGVDVVVDSLAASAGSFIAQAGETVTMTRNATLMIHDAHGLAIGNAADMTEMADLLDKMSDNIADIYAQRAGGTVEDWRDAMRAESWYSADEAVEAGLADEVRGGSSEQNSWDLSIFSYAGRSQAPAPAIPDPEPTPEPTPDPAEEFDLDGITAALTEAFS